MSATTTDTTRSSAEDALWAAIGTDPTTATDLATAAGVSESKTRKILRQWATDGSITRHTDDDNPRAAARWSLTTTETTETGAAVADAESDAPLTYDTITPTEGDDTTMTYPAPPAETVTAEDDAHTDCTPEPANEPTEHAESTDQAEPAEQTTDGDVPEQSKLAPGALRGLVEDHLRDHSGQEFSPHQIGKALGGRSSGAVHNALVKLVDAGVAKLTSDRPKKFTLSPTQS